MKLTLDPYQLRFKYPFKIAHGLREFTPLVYIKLEQDGFTAWGEAALPPYLPETQQSVIDFIGNFYRRNPNGSIDNWFEQLAADSSRNMSAKAALDMALWDLKAQIGQTTIVRLLGIESTNFPLGAYTIGVCGFEEMKRKFEEATGYGFKLFKLKLDGENDMEMIKNFRLLSKDKFAVDVNQGWANVAEAAQKISWLASENCFIVEQPLPKKFDNEMKLLKVPNHPLLFADESCQTMEDLERLWPGFNGINIKLMKCGGITPALKMMRKARELGFKIIVGCMSESSVGCTAAAQLSPLADFGDLDGNYLTSNDPFKGMEIDNGHIKLMPLKQILSLPAPVELKFS